MSEASQQFCLRWNNHSTNFVTVFEHLLKIEAFTDVTISGFDGPAIKCHKMVLAACSTYFQELFIKNPNEHPIIILSNVKYFELKAILDYMYRGEVNIAQNDLSELLKVAEFLKVKGLVDESQIKREEPDNSLSPSQVKSNNIMSSAAHSTNCVSPPTLSTNYHMPYHKSPIEKNQNHIPYWNGFPAALGLQNIHQMPTSSHKPRNQHAMLSSSYENASETSPLSRKKHSSHMLAANTPILRNVLGQGQVDSSQPMVVDHRLERPHDGSFCSNSNGSINDSDRRNSAELSEDERRMSPQNYMSTSNRSDGGGGGGGGGGGNGRKPEWKRYKQYTPQNIRDAIEAVVTKRMSALQAAKYYKVPSRTLYDKLKKAGHVPSRGSGPHRLSSGSLESSARFPYSSAVNGHVYGNCRPGSSNGGQSESDTETNGYAEQEYRDAELLANLDIGGGAPAAPSVSGAEQDVDEVMDMSRHSSSPNGAPVPDHPNVDDEVEDLSVGRSSSAPPPVGNDLRVIVPTGLPAKKEEETEDPENAGRV